MSYAEGAQLWYCSFDGQAWDVDQQVPDVGLTDSPALAVFNNQFYCIHQGYGDDGQLWYLASNAIQPAPISVEWFPDKQVPNAVLSTAPAAVVSG